VPYRAWNREGAKYGGRLVATIADPRSTDIPSSAPSWTLTAFERRNLELFAAGLPRGEIARLLKRAPKTISNSLTAAKDKLGARSLGEATALLAAEAVALALKANS